MCVCACVLVGVWVFVGVCLFACVCVRVCFGRLVCVVCVVCVFVLVGLCVLCALFACLCAFSFGGCLRLACVPALAWACVGVCVCRRDCFGALLASGVLGAKTRASFAIAISASDTCAQR